MMGRLNGRMTNQSSEVLYELPLLYGKGSRAESSDQARGRAQTKVASK
jgi:hypothetical protein